jgi:glutamate dehydrogenase/leucine dehydrogenase
MAERFNAPVLKTGVVKATGGSNPSLTANFGGVLVSTVLLMNEEARMSWSNGLIQNRLKKLNGEDNIAGLLDEAAAIMNNADVVLAGFEAEVVA